MPDSLSDLLAREADARIAGAVVPSVDEIHRRAELPSRAVRRRRISWLAPVVAAACVIALVLGVAQLPSLKHREAAQTAVIPPAPTLEPVVPPLVVRQRLGAPFGHLNGPPVASAQTLAVSPTKKNGRALRTVAVVTPHTLDRNGNPRVNRCRYTYTEPGTPVFSGRCDWALPVELYPTEAALTLEVKGGPGQTWLQGTAPAGTAAVLLRGPGRKQVVVAVGDPGASWSHRPFYVVWRDRIGTDLIAVDRKGHALGRARLPSETITHRPGDSEIGTVETPMGMWDKFGPRTCTFPSPGSAPATASPCKPTSATPPARIDVLARYVISDTVTLFRYGLISGDHRCVIDGVRDYRPDALPVGGGGGGGGCGSAPPGPGEKILTGRSFSAGTGKPEEQLLTGEALRGTVRIRLSAPGVKTLEIRAYDGGERWQHRAYFIAPWPSAPHTRVQAIGRDGQVLASTISRGMNPRAFDADFLEAEAQCMERRGIKVTRTAQGHGVPPMYGFERGSLTNEQMRTAQEACEDEAARTS
ncbi:MAG: hypothetical protein QOE05_2755 [Actinomycetota bacterium]|jgi:hypothetical protein|nr:hypothetical protein [Actinomycetota bacterium]